MAEILDNLEHEKHQKDRHGCVTAWLIVMIIVNSMTAVSYFLFGDTITEALPVQPSKFLLIAVGILAILNVIFAVILFTWKKIGFYGFVGTSIAALIFNLVMGLGVLQSLGGLIGIGVLYAVLQIKGKNGQSAWSGLE